MNPTILIVEDAPKISVKLKLLLEFSDYNKITATNGIEALEILSKLEIPPDLILCDIIMPKMGGLEFYQNLSKKSEVEIHSFYIFNSIGRFKNYTIY